VTNYDEKCFDLARYFCPNMDEKRLGELASLIQVTVEDFAPPDAGKRQAAHEFSPLAFNNEKCSKCDQHEHVDAHGWRKTYALRSE
jgi:hypothetical protein